MCREKYRLNCTNSDTFSDLVHGRFFRNIYSILTLLFNICLSKKKKKSLSDFVILMVEEDGFEPSKSETTDLQSAPFGRSGTPPVIMELVMGLEPATC